MHNNANYFPVSAIISLSPLIRKHRKKAGLSQQALADLANVARRTISNIEGGEEAVQLDILLKVLTILNMKLYVTGPFLSDEIQ